MGSIGGYIGGISALTGMFGNLFGGAGCCQAASPSLNRYEGDLMMAMSRQESENAILKSEKDSYEKMVEIYKDLNGQINTLKAVVQANKDEQAAINLQQATYNGVNTATIQCMQNQIQQLLGLTKLSIPNDSLNPGYGTAVVTPPAAAAA